MVEGRKLVCLELIVWIDITILFYSFLSLFGRQIVSLGKQILSQPHKPLAGKRPKLEFLLLQNEKNDFLKLFTKKMIF